MPPHRSALVALLAWVTIAQLFGPSELGAESPAAAPAAQDAPRRLELVGQIGGSTSAMALNGTTLVLNVGPRLVVVDAANRAEPRVLGQSEVLTDLIGDIALSWPYAYVAAGSAGLRVFDLSAPTAPRQVSAIAEGRVDAVLASHGALYTFGQDRGLLVYDLRMPSSPAEVGRDVVGRTGRAPSRMALDWPHLYVAAGSEGLLVYDVSNPRTPERLGRYVTPSRDSVRRDSREAGSVVLIDGYVYVGWVHTNSNMYYTTGVSVAEATDPSSLVEVAFMGRFGPAFFGPTVSAYGGRLYVVDRHALSQTSLAVYDVADPAILVSVYEAGNIGPIIAANHVAYALSGGFVNVMDLAQPGSPEELGRVSVVGPVESIAIDGPYAYAVGQPTGCRILDLSVPSQPREVRNLLRPVNAAEVDAQHVYLKEGTTDSTSVTVLRRNGTPEAQIVATVANVPAWYFGSPQFRWPYMYSWDSHHFAISDISTGVPRVIADLSALFPRPPLMAELSTSGRRLYAHIWTGEVGIFDIGIIDVADPHDPRLLGSFTVEHPTSAVATDTHFYVGVSVIRRDGERRGLSVWDVADPQDPRETSYIPTDSLIFPQLVGGRLLVKPTRVFNLEDPSHPRSQSFEAPRLASGEWTLQDDLVFVAAGAAGLLVYRLPPGV
jgi:hypothetical protein